MSETTGKACETTGKAWEVMRERIGNAHEASSILLHEQVAVFELDPDEGSDSPIVVVQGLPDGSLTEWELPPQAVRAIAAYLRAYSGNWGATAAREHDSFNFATYLAESLGDVLERRSRRNRKGASLP